LAKDLLAMYKQDVGLNRQPQKECCKKNEGNNFCPKCGTHLRPQKVLAGDFQDWLLGLLSRDLDSVGTLEEDVTERDVVWELGHSALELVGEDPDRVLILSENAERSLCQAVGLED
jgi:hypothetical protein